MLKREKTKFNADLILAIDIGTQSVRAVLIDLQGNIQAIEKIHIEPYHSPQPGWTEQDPDLYWRSLCQASQKVLKKISNSHDLLRGLSITAQRNTVVNVDKEGKPLRPAIVWMDMRKAKLEAWPPFPLKLALKTINILDAIQHTIQDCEANWIRQNQPHIWQKTAKHLYLSGYITHKLVGEYRDSAASIVGYVPFDYRSHDWAKPSDMKWQMFPMSKEMLPDIVPPGSILGEISQAAAKQTGIPAGLPVVAAGADKSCEVLGSGCITPKIACLSFGTTATVQTTSSKYTEIVPFFPPYPSAIPGYFNTEVMIYRGFWMISWFKKEFGHREQQLAEKQGLTPEQIFDQVIQDIPPGCQGLMLQPFWSPGVKVPGPEAKGSIIGFGDIHTRAHVYRAILEGLGFALKEGLERTVKKTKVPVETLRVSGGGSQSNVAMQLTADIFNLPAERPHTFETSALGAAIDTAVGLKLHSSFDQAIHEMVRIGVRYEPIAQNVRIYQELYDQVYSNIYSKLKPLYENIRKITGYPKIH